MFLFSIDGDVSLSLIETLLTSAGQGRLKSLTIYIHQLGIPSGAFDVMMLRMARWVLLFLPKFIF